MPSKPFYLITRSALLVALLAHGFTILLEKYPPHERSDAAPTFDLANLTPAQKQLWAAQQMWAAQQPPLLAFDIEARDDVKIILATPEMAPKPKPDANWSFTFEPPVSESVAKFRPILEDEWRHLPASLVKKCGLKRIILCSELEFNGQSIGGFASDNIDIYFDLSLSTIQDSPYVRRLIHHMEQWGKTDAIIEAKREQMMKIVKDFCPDVNDEFWAQLKQIPRQPG